MTTTTPPDLWNSATSAFKPVPRPRIRGLSMPALPSWPLITQVAGFITAECGVYLQWGLAVTLIIGGVAAVVVGALREAGKV